MTQEELDAITSTFPWTEQRVITPHGGLIRMLDKNGNEVSLLAMTAFLQFISRKVAKNAEASAPKTPA